MSRSYKYTAMQAYHGLQRPGGNGGLGSLGPKPPPWSKGGRGNLSYEATVLVDSPYIYFPMNETGGTSAENVGSYSPQGTYAGSPSLGNTSILPSAEGTTVNFDATNDKIGLTPTLAADLDTNVMTLEAWIKSDLTGIGSRCIINTCDSGPTSSGLLYYLNTDNGSFAVTGYASGGERVSWSSLFTFAANTVYHVAVTIDFLNPANTHYYVDGVDIGTGQAWPVSAAPSHDALSDLTVGVRYSSSTPTFWFDGAIDHAALYKSELSAAQILAHYNAGT